MSKNGPFTRKIGQIKDTSTSLTSYNPILIKYCGNDPKNRPKLPLIIVLTFDKYLDSFGTQ